MPVNCAHDSYCNNWSINPISHWLKRRRFNIEGPWYSVIGGLASSTLIVVPIVYEVLSKIFKKNRKDIVED
jgi:hypothetical protein